MTNLSQRKRENPVEKNPEPLSSTLTGDRNTKIHTKKKKKKWITLFWFRKISKIRVSTRKAIEKSHHITMKKATQLSTQTAKKKFRKFILSYCNFKAIMGLTAIKQIMFWIPSAHVMGLVLE